MQDGEEFWIGVAVKIFQLFALCVALGSGAILAADDNVTLKKQEPSKEEGAGCTAFENISEAPHIPYSIEYRGTFPLFMVKEFESESTLVRDRRRGVTSERVAIKRAKHEKILLRHIFFRYGYFDAKIETKVRFSSRLANICYIIDLGTRYEIKDKKINIIDNPSYHLAVADPFLKVQKKEGVHFPDIITTQKLVKAAFKNEGFYFARIEKPDLVVSPQTKTAKLVYSIYIGKPVVVECIEVPNGLHVPKKFLLARLAFREGDRITCTSIERSKENLMGTGLFANVHLTVKKKASALPEDSKQKAILKIDTIETPPRTVGAGAHYTASEGIIGSAMWQHKNFLNKAHSIGAIATIGQKEMTATLFYDIPDLLRANQKWHMISTLKHLRMKAYEGNTAEVTMGIIQSFSLKKHDISLSLLPTIEHNKLTRKASYQHNLVSFKTNVNLNFTNHRIYPTAGIIFDLSFQPFFGSFSRIEDSKDKDQKNQISVSDTVHSMARVKGVITGYIPLKKNNMHVQNTTILATFLSVGSVIIKDFEYIPFDKRFYGDGRDSIRSYGYQMAGEIDSDGCPVGGASILEACIEPRLRISEDFGLVVFFDGNYASSKRFPDFKESKNILTGGGFGIRYYTKFGPIRLDIGFPFRRRLDANNKKMDKAFQIYISVGQTF